MGWLAGLFGGGGAAGVGTAAAGAGAATGAAAAGATAAAEIGAAAGAAAELGAAGTAVETAVAAAPSIGGSVIADVMGSAPMSTASPGLGFSGMSTPQGEVFAPGAGANVVSDLATDMLPSETTAAMSKAEQAKIWNEVDAYFKLGTKVMGATDKALGGGQRPQVNQARALGPNLSGGGGPAENMGMSILSKILTSRLAGMGGRR